MQLPTTLSSYEAARLVSLTGADVARVEHHGCPSAYPRRSRPEGLNLGEETLYHSCSPAAIFSAPSTAGATSVLGARESFTDKDANAGSPFCSCLRRPFSPWSKIGSRLIFRSELRVGCHVYSDSAQ